jgi:hypothetical protein
MKGLAAMKEWQRQRSEKKKARSEMGKATGGLRRTTYTNNREKPEAMKLRRKVALSEKLKHEPKPPAIGRENQTSGHELYDKSGFAYHTAVKNPNSAVFNRLGTYATMNLGVLQHHMAAVVEHGRSCLGCELVVKTPQSNMKWWAGSMYCELEMECQACKAISFFPTDGFNTDPTVHNKRTKLHSQLSYRQCLAVVGNSASFVSLDTIAATTGNISRMSRRNYNRLTYLISLEVEQATNEKIQKNREVCKSTIRQLAAAGRWDTEVLPQGRAGVTPRFPTHSR